MSVNEAELFYSNQSLEDIDGEEWLDIPGYDGMYQASTLGRIKSLKREFYRKGDSKPRYTEEHILTQIITQNKTSKAPALYVGLSVNGIKKTDTVSQWIGITFIGDKKRGFRFQHKSKNTLDNRLENIEQVTIKASMQNDFKKDKREAHNKKCFEPFMKRKYKIIREDGVEMTYSEIAKTYGRSSYLNIMKGSNVRGYKWEIIPL